MRIQTLPWSAACLAAFTSLGCVLPDDEPPGDGVGRFEITGVVGEHSCGQELIPVTNDIITADVWRDERRAFWQTIEGPLVRGVIVDDEYQFREPQTITVTAPDPRRNITGCVVSRIDSIEFRLDGDSDNTDAEDQDGDPADTEDQDGGTQQDGGAQQDGDAQQDGGVADAGVEDSGAEDDPDAGTSTPMTLEGINTIEFEPVAGSDCRFAVAAGGGPFLTLPCRVDIALDGERVSEP